MQYDSESFIVDGNEFEFVNNFMNYVDCVTTIKFHVVKNVVLKIKYKMQVGTPSDYLIFKRNESQLLKKNSTNSWENYSISLNSGDVFLILYEKDGFTFSADEEKFWIEIQQEQIEYSDSMSLKPLCEYDIKCLTCDSVLVEKTGHNFKEKEVNDTYFSSSATCTAKAKYYYSCYCGAKGTTMFEYGELKAHTYSQLYNFDNSHHWQDATCGCDLKQNYGEHTPDSSGFCTVCDKPINPTEGVLYDYSSDGTYIEVIGYVGTATKVKIADTYDNLPVKTIYREAFKGTNITSIEIPDSVTSIGYDAFYNCKSLKSIVLPNSVTSIASEAFYGCSSLTSIEIPDSVTSIGSYAFYNCSSLTSIEIPNSVTSIRDYAFSGCSSLTSIEIPDSVISIGDYAFLGCRSLTSIVIPNSVTSIGDSAFRGCRSLQSITLPFVGAKAGVKDSDTYQYPFGYIFGTSSYTGSYSATQYYYGSSTSSTTYNYYYIPSSLKSVTITGGNILRGAFYNCSSLTSIEIPASVSSIGDYAFYGCTSLYLTENNLKYVKLNGTPYYILIEAANKNFSTYKINSQTKYIEAEAFGGCTRLSSITVPDGITSIGSYAFSNCSSLETIEIPDSVTSIGSGAFSGCSSLESIILPFVGAKADVKDSDTYQYPFGYIFGTYSYTGSYSATQSYYGSSTSSTTSTTYYIPSSLKIVTITGGNILRGAFYNCSSLTSITIPSSVTSIGSSAFYDCSSLTSLTIGSGVISIDYNAFYGCSNISKVNYLGTIDEWVQINFYGSYSNPTYYSKDLYINNVLLTEANITTASKIEYYAFYNCSSLTSVTIGNSVTTIGNYAFYYCTSLTKVNYLGTIDEWVQINFYGSYSNPTYYSKDLYINNVLLTEANITTASKIEYYAFYNCSSLTSVTIGNSVTRIGSGAFSGCSSLQSITLPFVGADAGGKSNETRYPFGYIFGESSYNGSYSAKQEYYNAPTSSYIYGTYYIPSSLKSVTITGGNIVYSAFYNCYSLTNVVLGDSVTSIGSYAFSGCTSLTEINFNAINCADLSSNNYVFYNAGKNGGGIAVVFGDKVTKIPAYLFYPYSNNSYYLPKITSVTIGNSVTSIGSSAFDGCTSLTKVNYLGTIDEWVQINFYGSYSNPTYYSKDLYINNVLLTEANITTATKIEDYAFYNCSSLTSVTIGNSVTSIGSYAFYNCSSLTSIEIPDSVTSIGSYAFAYCSSLTSIEIPDSVTSIGFSAFAGCSSLDSIILPFVGEKAGVKDSDTYQYPFGYIFGESSYNGSYSAAQSYYSSSTSGTTSSTYYIPSSLKTVTIKGGNILYGAFRNCSSLTSIVISDSVTSIGDYAFSGCSSLTSIEIPDSVTSIGSYAFNNCHSSLYLTENNLKYVKAKGNSYYILIGVTNKNFSTYKINSQTKYIGSYAFAYCSSLTSIEIPDSVTSIGFSAFAGCSSLTSIEIPDSVKSIWGSAFYNCYSLTSVTFAENSQLTSIGSYAFYSCSKLTSLESPDSLTSIGYSAFYNCSSLTSVMFGENSQLTSIGDWAFRNCRKLTSLESPDSLTSIGSEAFEDCTSLTNVIFGENSQLTSIGSYAFYNCKSLTNIEIPDSVTSIGSSAFDGCSNLEYNIEGNLKYLGNSENKYLYLAGTTSVDINSAIINANCKLIGSYAFSGCSSLTSIEIPEGVTSIGSYAFSSCKALTSVEIPNSVTSIGDNAFRDSTSLTSIVLPDSVTSIGYSAFYDCDSLTSIVIGDSVTSIGSYAFAYCTSLTNIEIPNSVTSIGSYAFYGCSSLTNVVFENPNGWWRASYSNATSGTSISSSYLSKPSTAATYLKSTYDDYYWKRS